MPTASSKPPAILPAILWGAFVAGTVDIGAASVITGLASAMIMKIVAGGLLGRSAFDGDASIAVLGMALQWGMSLLIAAIFVFAALRLSGLTRRWIASGIAYGVVVYFAMNYVVVPLSALGHGMPRFDPKGFCENMLAMILFGLIVAFSARRFLHPRPAS